MSARAPLPVTLVAGYLGAGKTTLVNHLLAKPEGRRLVVLVNDFGDIAIDAELIAAASGDMLSLANGCACCAVGGDLFRAFTSVLDMDPAPDQVVIEASGVAEPARIADIARAEPDLRLDGIVVLVDALNAPRQRDDALIGQTLVHQIAAASLIVIAKADLVPAGSLAAMQAWLGALNAGTPVLTAARGRLDADIVLGPRDLPAMAVEHRHAHDDAYERWSIRLDAASVSRGDLADLLAAVPPDIIRLKGIVRDGQGAWEFHVAGTHREVLALTGRETGPPGLVAVAIAAKGKLDRARLDGLFAGLVV